MDISMKEEFGEHKETRGVFGCGRLSTQTSRKCEQSWSNTFPHESVTWWSTWERQVDTKVQDIL